MSPTPSARSQTQVGGVKTQVLSQVSQSPVFPAGQEEQMEVDESETIKEIDRQLEESRIPIR